MVVSLVDPRVEKLVDWLDVQMAGKTVSCLADLKDDKTDKLLVDSKVAKKVSCWDVGLAAMRVYRLVAKKAARSVET